MLLLLDILIIIIKNKNTTASLTPYTKRPIVIVTSLFTLKIKIRRLSQSLYKKTNCDSYAECPSQDRTSSNYHNWSIFIYSISMRLSGISQTTAITAYNTFATHGHIKAMAAATI